MKTAIDMNKLKNIEKIVQTIASEQAKKMMFKADAFSKGELEKTKEELEAKQELAKAQAECSFKRERIQRLLKLEATQKERLIELRNKIRDEVFRKVESKLQKYIETDDYLYSELEKLLSLEDLLKSDDVVVFVRPQDVERFKLALQEKLGHDIMVIADDKIAFGGFRLRNNEKRICVDATIGLAIDEEKQGFFAFAGLEIA